MRLDRYNTALLLTLALACCQSPEDVETPENVTTDSTTTTDTIVPTIEDPLLTDTLASERRTNELTLQEDVNCADHFEIAMNQPVPDDITILHCSYWSSDHPIWLEHSYSFEIEKNDAFFQELIDYNSMVEIKDNHEMSQHQENWFLPKKISQYEGFYTEDDFDDFQIFRDTQNGNIFIRGSQY